VVASPAPVAPVEDRGDIDFLSVTALRQQLSDYETAKLNERQEADESRRYYHGDQWTSDEVRILRSRNQPVITYNRIKRKIDGVVGVVERLRQDPKGFPRTPQQQNGADIATAVMNYALDINQWKAVSPAVAKAGAVEPLAGIELEVVPGDRGDADVALHYLDPRDVFYDPRSTRPDFTDARYIGVAKWIALDSAIGMFPEYEREIRSAATAGGGYDALANNDRDRRLSAISNGAKHVRLVEHWYKRGDGWLYQFYCGDLALAQGESPFVDEKGVPFCRFILFSADVDHDNDRYGFVRNLKGPQDEINHRRSKGIHALHSWRLSVENGTVDDIDGLRAEAHRPDAVLITPSGAKVAFENNADLVRGNLEMLTEAKNEIENFGPNQALIGGLGASASGRAIQLLQQAGISELGPYLIEYTNWKKRVYRAVWNIIQQYWTAERWVRVTDDDGLAQFLQVNGLGTDPQTGMPTLINALGSLDVDIIVDEGPDHTTLMEDTLEGLMSIAPGMAQAGKPLPPEIFIELASLPQATKNKILGYLQQSQQPDPAKQQAAQAAERLQFEGAAAKVDETRARAEKLRADAQRAPGAAGKDIADLAEQEADVRLKHAKAAGEEADVALKFMAPVPTPLGVMEGAYASGSAGMAGLPPASPY